MHQKTKLTDKTVQKLPVPERGNKLHFDSDCSGFACRVTANGARSYIFNYRADGRQRRFTIGSTDEWSATAARKKAVQIKGDVAKGDDPLGEREEERNAKTVDDLCQEFIDTHFEKLAPSSRSDYQRMIDKYIRPNLGKRKVSEVAFKDVDALHRKITKTGATYVANRCVAVMSKMFNLSIKWGWRSDNPALFIERNREEPRDRYLSAEEMQRLATVLVGFKDQQAANIVRLLLMTGARRNEVLTMKWEQIDLTAGTWSKPASGTKQKKLHHIPLGAAALQLLSAIRDEADTGSEYVFPGRDGKTHRVNVKSAWARIRKQADLPGLRLHDLRHSHASFLIAAGHSLPFVGRLLGHSQASTTQRYAHLGTDPLRQAVDTVSAIVSGQPSAEVLPMRKKDGS